jgi:hypothetical protein
VGGAGYTRIPGSAALPTKRRGTSVVEPVLAAERASLARVDVEVGARSVTVGRAVVRGPSVPLLLDVVDRVAPLLEPEELAVFLHLYRLALVDEKNVCRVSRSELSRRTRLQDRRLGKAIAGLVQKGHVVLVDRDRDGTLYRVLLPDESLDGAPLRSPPVAADPTPPARPTGQRAPKQATPEPPAPAGATGDPGRAVRRNAALIASARAGGLDAGALDAGGLDASARAGGLARRAGPGATGAGEAGPPRPRSVGDVCAWFAATHGQGAGRTGADVAAVVLELLEEGHTFARIPALLSAFVARAPKTTPLRDLPRVLADGEG